MTDDTDPVQKKIEKKKICHT